MIDIPGLQTMFEDAASLTSETRAEAELARDYYNGLQYTDAEKTELAKRGQPALVFNRIRRKLDYISGLEQQSRTDPKAYPRNPQDEAAAESATDALRYVEDHNQLDEIFSSVFNEMMVEGYGGLEVSVKDTRRGPEITVEHWQWDRLFYDPHSSRPDFSDASYMGGVIWMGLQKAQERWPDAKDALGVAFDNSPAETYEDKPRNAAWFDNTNGNRRVKIVQIWYHVGSDWHWCLFSGDVKLEGGKSPYVNDDGESMCLMLLQSGYVDRDNGRHGVVRDMFSPQDAINKSRSKSMHLINMRQTFSTKGAIGDVNRAKREIAKPDGHIEIEGTFGANFGVVPTNDMASGNLALLQDAKAEMDLMGPNAAMQGKSSQDASGRSILAQQQGGMVELTPMLNRLRSLKLRTFRLIWSLIRQTWTAEKWIRVTDDENKVKFVGMNRPVSIEEALRADAAEQGVPPQEVEALVEQARMAGEDMDAIHHVENVAADMDMDIVLDESPDVITMQQEQFEAISNMVAAGLPIPPRAVIKASALRNKDEILAEMEGSDNPEAAKAAQAQQQMQMRDAEAKIRKTEAEADKSEAQAVKTMTEVQGPIGPSIDGLA
ncbi:MAG: hypothetical protein WAT93_09945 [Pontixanthobacter sp.]